MRAAPHHILVVDDDSDSVEIVREILSGDHVRITTARSVEDALAAVRQAPVDCVVSDVCMPGADGFTLLDTLRRENVTAPFIFLTGYGGLDDAVRAVGRGVERYLAKPVRAPALREAVRTALERSAVARRTASSPGIPAVPREAIVGKSAAIVGLYSTIARAAGSHAPVLIRGETGVGKEWVARAIHRYSARSLQPFVPVNCSALPEGTLESELFGHARGSFTGAVVTRKGLFQLAHQGVLFLDEVGELSLRVQAELLRVLQEGEIRPLGADETVAVDVRVVCATHRDLDQLVAIGRFREDLLFRLRVIEIMVAPLRERREDIPLLAEHFLAHSRSGKVFSAEALVALARRDWRGNVRELQSAVHRAAALAAGAVILPADLPPPFGAYLPAGGGAGEPVSLPALWERVLSQGIPSLEEIEASFVRAVVRQLNGNKTQAAEVIGVDRKTIRRILARSGEFDD